MNTFVLQVVDTAPFYGRSANNVLRDWYYLAYDIIGYNISMLCSTVVWYKSCCARSRLVKESII